MAFVQQHTAWDVHQISCFKTEKLGPREAQASTPDHQGQVLCLLGEPFPDTGHPRGGRVIRMWVGRINFPCVVQMYICEHTSVCTHSRVLCSCLKPAQVSPGWELGFPKASQGWAVPHRRPKDPNPRRLPAPPLKGLPQ